MKNWHVGLKLDLGDGTLIQTYLIVKAADKLDAVASALSSVLSGAKVISVVEET